jgi:hypothetical protein
LTDKPIRFTGLDAILGLALILVLGYGAYRIQVQLHYRWNWGSLPRFICRYDARAERWVPNE